MPRPPRTIPFALAALLIAPAALAGTRASAPAGGGLAALDVKVDLAKGAVDANGTSVPISLDHASLPSEADVTVESVAIGGGKHIVHVVVPAKDAKETEGLAWEALLAAGQKQPIFAGLTGFVSGDPGERTGQAIRVVADGETSFVLVGDIREDLRICGQAWTMIAPRALYAESLDLRATTAQRLTPAEQESAQRIAAIQAGVGAAPALAKLLVARGSSVPGSRGLELTDGDASTVWSERRPKMGQGEFVVMAAPKEVPIARMQVVVAPPSSSAANRSGASPKTFYLVTDTERFEVTLPGDAWLRPGEAYDIAFPRPVETSCVALVLSDAYTRDLPHPDVSVAELVAFSELDRPGATLEDVAKKLSGERGGVAAQVLERAGDKALEAVSRVYDGLDEAGRARAVDVAAVHEPCVEAGPLLVRGLRDKGGEAPRKAREKLEQRCKGGAAALAASMRENPATRACVAPTLAVLAGAEALEPIAEAFAGAGDADHELRGVLRESFSLALTSAPAARFATVLRDARFAGAARLEMLRAAGTHVNDAPAESGQALTELLGGAPSMRVRYLALGPLGELAHAGDSASVARIADSVAHDAEWPVRARAAEVAAGLPEAQGALMGAARDPEPRVREAALQALSVSPPPAAFDVARAVLSTDGWPFVQTQAIAVLVKAPLSVSVDDALRDAMRAESARVRGAALVVVSLRRTATLRGAVRDRLDDKDEDVEVRAAAARALGALCDASSVDRLTELARVLGAPETTEDQQQIALGALVGLAALQPSDLRARIASLASTSAPPYVRAAAQRALSARTMCR